jgi:nucleoside-diphosphate-sugar epimerase
MPLALITGATGMLGGRLAEKLHAQGVALRAFVRPTSDAGPLRALSAEVVYGDSADEEAIRRAVEGVDWLFHTAGHLTPTAPFEAESTSPLYQAVNVDFTRRLLEAGQGAGIGRFVYASSSSVYDRDAPVPTPEDAPLRPASAYGRSKLQAEQLVRAFQEKGLAGVIVRPVLIYGPGDRHFMPIALRLARLPVVPLVEGGRNLLDLAHVDDVADLMIRAARQDAAINRVYNAGPGVPHTLADLVNTYRSLTGRGPRIVPVSLAAASRSAWLTRWLISLVDPDAGAVMTPDGLALISLDMHLDMTRARQELGFTPAYDLARGLASVLNGME